MKFVLPAIATSLMLLTGCASRISGDVTTFHENVMPAGETIRIVAANPADDDSLEFRSYANRISDELRKVGYTPVMDANAPTDLIAEVNYSIEEGPSMIYTDNSNSYMRYHFGLGSIYSPLYSGFYGRSFYNPFFYDPLWDQPQVYSEPTFNRSLELYIEEADGERIYEGRVESNGVESSLPQVMPYLITAMFDNFPGESGTTKVVTIETDM